MRSTLLLSLALAAVVGVAQSTAVQAEEVFIPDDEDAYAVESPVGDDAYATEAPDPEALPPDEFDYPAQVYGWIALRPANCGTFRYWNGEYCADARREPLRE
jgi:hypothetical protein